MSLSNPSPNIAGDELDGPLNDNDSIISNLRTSHAAISTILRSSIATARELDAVDGRLSCRREFLSGIAAAISPLQSQALATKALNRRINQAVSPAISFLQAFSRARRLERRLLSLSSAGSNQGGGEDHTLLGGGGDRPAPSGGGGGGGGGGGVGRLQDAVEFLERTKATDKLRLKRLRNAAAALGTVCEEEVEQMRYEGPLDEALLRLQDKYEEILRRLHHPDVAECPSPREGKWESDGMDLLGQGMDGPDWPSLGSAEEIEVLRRISETLASNDCLDICIDIFVKVRYRKVAKALMRLNPEYLKSYEPEDIDRIEWESLESSISLWINHLRVAVHSVLSAEKHLSRAVLSSAMDGAVWPECRSNLRPHNGRLPPLRRRRRPLLSRTPKARPVLSLLFDDAAPDIAARFRELQKLLVNAASRAFATLENLPDASPPPADASVPGVVRYVINYLKCLADGSYASAMVHVLRTESLWKAGFLSRPDPDEALLRESLARALDALRANVEMKRGRYRDRVAAQLFAMNSYWYMYMRTRGSELARLVGEEEMREKYRAAAEAAAFAYQKEAWGAILRMAQSEVGTERGEAARALARGKVEVFVREVEENLRMHRMAGYKIPDKDLREQIKKAVKEMLVPAYESFLQSCSAAMQGRVVVTPEALKELIGRLFECGGGDDTVPSPGGGRLRRERRRGSIIDEV
ncbi:exocyst complex component EXO70A1-like [Phalaenopsis equestris]|uniref:exocyst complex component EXO70A1-like n=1 Tax=Phalaenopsis equestris TaxID=78828 RepID=UPI0009E35793|nr:exocyst complex component EXO70A1-like [Phalaenopsis equestris]